MRTLRLLALAAVAALQLNAANFHVSTTGADTNTGATNSPWKHIVYAINKMSANDTLWIEGGTYNESLGSAATTGQPPNDPNIPSKMIIKSGTGSGYTTIRAYTGQRAIIRPDNTWNTEVLLFGGYNFNPILLTNVLLQDLTFDASGNTVNSPAVKVQDASSCIFSNVVITNAWGNHGILIAPGATNNQFWYCTSANNGQRGFLESVDQHAWYVGGDSNMFWGCVGYGQSGGNTPHAWHINATGGAGSVNNNLFVNCVGYGGPGASAPPYTNIASRAFGAYQGTGNKFIGCVASNAVIGFYAAYAAVNTVFDNDTARDNYYGLAVQSAGTTGTIIRNLLSSSNTTYGVFFGSGIGTTVMSNSIVSKTFGVAGAANIRDDSGGAALYSGRGNLIGDQYLPLFVSSTSAAIQSTSPARNAGLTISGNPTLDPAGNTRGTEGSWDIGAYEYTSGGTTPTVTITAGGNATEGGSAGSFVVTRSGSTSGALTVNFTISGSSTATETTDYSSIGTSVVIADGQPSATITITAVDDTAIEGTETVILNLAAGSYTIANPSTATVNINDNDAASIRVPRRIKQ